MVFPMPNCLLCQPKGSRLRLRSNFQTGTYWWGMFSRQLNYCSLLWRPCGWWNAHTNRLCSSKCAVRQFQGSMGVLLPHNGLLRVVRSTFHNRYSHISCKSRGFASCHIPSIEAFQWTFYRRYHCLSTSPCFTRWQRVESLCRLYTNWSGLASDSTTSSLARADHHWFHLEMSVDQSLRCQVFPGREDRWAVDRNWCDCVVMKTSRAMPSPQSQMIRASIAPSRLSLLSSIDGVKLVPIERPNAWLHRHTRLDLHWKIGHWKPKERVNFG